MKKKTGLFLVLTALALAGCGLYKWTKPGAGDDQFKADSAACDQVHNPDGYTACMNQRGWTLNQ